VSSTLIPVSDLLTLDFREDVSNLHAGPSHGLDDVEVLCNGRSGQHPSCSR